MCRTAKPRQDRATPAAVEPAPVALPAVPRVAQPLGRVEGRGVGRLVIIRGEPDPRELAKISADSIVALEFLPTADDTIGPWAGIITFRDEGETSHAAALASEAYLEAYRAAVTRGVRGLRVGVARGAFFEGLEPGVLRAVEATLGRLRGAGARVRDISLPTGGVKLYDEMFGPIAVSEIRATYARAFRARPDAFSKEFAAVFDGPAVSAAALANAREARDAVQRSIEAVLEDADVILTPTVPMMAPPIAGPIDGIRILQNTWVFNAARVPAVSVPCGTGANGLPVGLQLVGRPFGEPALLAVATLIERLGAA